MTATPRRVVCLGCWALLQPTRPDFEPICPRCGSERLEDVIPGTYTYDCAGCGRRGQARSGDSCPDCGGLLIKLNPGDIVLPPPKDPPTH